MKLLTKSTLALAAGLLTLPAFAQVTFYEHNDYRGRTYMTAAPVQDFRSVGFNDRASSVVVQGGRWEVCSNTEYAGTCRVLQPGNYPALGAMGLNDQISSTRPYDRRREVAMAPPPPAAPAYEYRRRPNERTFEVPVSSSRAIVGQATERCWIEHTPGTEPERSDASVGRGLLGAVIGGVLGHQVGGGRGKDIATVGGAVAGAAIGANSGREYSQGTPATDVRRCKEVASTAPTHWDVGYDFRGTHHQIQMNEEPGRTVTVNRDGLPRQ